MSNIVTSDEYAARILAALGIDPKDAKVRRIVIDVTVSQAIKVYVEAFGTDKLVDVQLPTSGVEIITNGLRDS